jgi:hypothetical protein
MALSPWALLAAIAACCGLMFGEVGATAPLAAAKHFLGGLKQQQQQQEQQQQQQEHGFVPKDKDPPNRRLQTRACGDEIGRVTKSELEALVSILSQFLSEEAGALLDFHTGNARIYNVVAYKVCGSCAELETSLSAEALLQDESVFGSFSSYCGSEKYGFSAQHSALVFVPTDTTETTDTTTSTARTETTTIAEGSLRSLVSMHYAKVTVSSAPTEQWPTSLTEALAPDADTLDLTEILYTFINYLAPLMAAGAGSVAILPDYIGYGESSETHNRTYGYPPTYMQAAVTTWMATKEAIEEDTYGWSTNDGNGCTAMDAVVSVAGVSEGGYAAIAAGPALQQAGVRVLSIRAGVTFLDPGEQIEFAVGMSCIYKYVWIVFLFCGYKDWTVTSLFILPLLSLLLTESFDTGRVTLETESAIYARILPLIGFVFSSENPGLANSGTDQLALASEWRVTGDFDRDIISWFESPGLLTDEEIASRMLSIDVPSIFNADYLDLVRQARAANVSFACRSDFVLEGVTDKLCEAVNSVSLLDVVANMDIPLQLCYSEDDTVISFLASDTINANVTKYTGPLELLGSDINYFGNANVTKFVGPFGQPISGDHISAVILCSMAPLVGRGSFLDIYNVDRPNLISPLMGEQAAVCAASKAAPSSAPTTFRTGMPASGATLTFSLVAASSGIALAVALLSLSMF